MINKKSVLCIIPARKGSKGLKDKNIKKLKNLTLIDWAIKCALESKYIDKIVLSTDYEIKKLSKLSLKYYVKRKQSLATDTALSFDVIKNILEDQKKKKINYDIVVLLEPPAPFRNAKLVDKCIRLLNLRKASSVVTLKKLDDYHPIRVKKFISKDEITDFIINEPDKGLPRQKQVDAFIRDTSVYVFKSNNFLNSKNLLYGKKKLGIFNPNKYAINIDTELDYMTSKLVLQNNLIKKKDIPKL